MAKMTVVHRRRQGSQEDRDEHEGDDHRKAINQQVASELLQTSQPFCLYR